MKLAKMRVVEMRKELDSRGLDSTGTRPTLMKRLREALSREQPDNPVEHHPGRSQQADQRESRPTAQSKLQTIRERDNQRPTTHQITAPSKSNPSPNDTPQIPEGDKSLATGSIEKSSEISLDERMQKRRERFGTANNAPVTTDDAIERRRKRFGIVRKDDEEKPAKRPHLSNVVDKQAVRDFEEAKKRRAIKFGISLSAGKALGAENSVTAEEMEKRLKRQRRFQQVGS